MAKCFYPNGNPSLEDDIPCGSGDAVACCPLNWICQSNGLCYLENEDYYGRYTCTDKGWGQGCPNICTYGEYPDLLHCEGSTSDNCQATPRQVMKLCWSVRQGIIAAIKIVQNSVAVPIAVMHHRADSLWMEMLRYPWPPNRLLQRPPLSPTHLLPRLSLPQGF